MIEAKGFKDDLKRRSSETAKKALAAKPRPVVKNPEPSTEVTVLKEILEFLRNYKPGNPGSANFVVTERDENGKIKSFKVES